MYGDLEFGPGIWTIYCSSVLSLSPGHRVWGEAEEGGAGDKVGDVDQVHEDDDLDETIDTTIQ